MTRDDYDAFCASLPLTTQVVQWGDASVWKIGGKVFAIGGWFDGPEFAVTFKCSETSFAILKELPGLRPAPYLASRGLTWSSASTRAPSATMTSSNISNRATL
jgi:predicted DNA-binding protein (MmcQ/YjbR family)